MTMLGVKVGVSNATWRSIMKTVFFYWFSNEIDIFKRHHFISILLIYFYKIDVKNCQNEGLWSQWDIKLPMYGQFRKLDSIFFKGDKYLMARTVSRVISTWHWHFWPLNCPERMSKCPSNMHHLVLFPQKK